MTASTANKKLVVEIISDIVCPWCWVGKRKLETAVKTYKTPLEDLEVIWRPYQLRPNAPIEGVPKAPDTPNNPRVGHRLKEAGNSVGINFSGLTDRSPNTLLPHALLEYALDHHGWEKQNEVQEAIFQAYFTDGIFPDKKNLVSIGQACGLDEEKVDAALQDEKLLNKVAASVQENYSEVHGQGVPFFIFNGRPAFSGAQDPSTFHQVFDLVLNEQE